MVTGPGSGSPVAVNASVIDNADSPAATAPANTATPTSTGHTALLRRPEAVVVMRPAYGVTAVTPQAPAGTPSRREQWTRFIRPKLKLCSRFGRSACTTSVSAGSSFAAQRFALEELVAGDLVDLIHIEQDAA
ncbi:hypothetical protein MMOR_25360 [Mycolicibacterium moriokaense]|uniref:Uncharacterized protein n=1 Tax=Mycolicibacterium moriokaense TaxID=39691 RepID=A0AAD1HA51_9MYCO|nr:hypothetical protein MMOR_25360 [Mycolicibacterium moriokaense]